MYLEQYQKGERKVDKAYYNQLELFYDPTNACPDGKKGKLKKRVEGDKLIMECSTSGFKSEIERAQYVNLYSIKYQQEQTMIETLFKLVNGVQTSANIDLEALKKQYLEAQKVDEELEKIFGDERKILKNALDKQFEKIHESILLYNKRKGIYKQIGESISGKNRKILNEAFKKGKASFSGLAKQTKLSEKTIKSWFDWLDAVKKYVTVMQEVNRELKQYQETLKNQYLENTQFLLKQGSFKETKSIKVK